MLMRLMIREYNPPQQPMTVIEIRPHSWGWKAFESPGVEPAFPKKDQAIDYAQNRACFRSEEVRISYEKRSFMGGSAYGSRTRVPALRGLCPNH